MRHISPQMLQSARDYAAGDRSDPFTFARAMTHLHNGIASAECRYEAEEGTETRTLPDGRTYQATVYWNMKRP